MKPEGLNRRALVILLGSIFWLSPMIAQSGNALMIDHGSFIVSFRPDLGIPERVEWRVSYADLGKEKRSSTYRFRSDKATPKPRVTPDIYTNSGFHRGHMCPAADRSASKSAMRSTFIMSNICPMTPSVNTGSWKYTEIVERALAGRRLSCLITACPLFFPQDTAWIGRHQVAIPHAFMKVITIEGDPFFYKLFIIENK